MGLMTTDSHHAASASSRWWSRLDRSTRHYLLTHASGDELPVDIWRACLASALAEGTVERDDWTGDLPAHHLPAAAASYVETLADPDRFR